jgi:hypothetical protein
MLSKWSGQSNKEFLEFIEGFLIVFTLRGDALPKSTGHQTETSFIYSARNS